MGELWAVYDENRQKTGKIAERDVTQLKEGEYHIIVNGIILNFDNKILIDRRNLEKKYGGMWECSGGSILKGESSLEGILRELREELGIVFSENEAIFLKEIKRVKVPCDFKDLWLFRRDIKDEEITMPDGEVTEFKWVTIDEFMEMYENGEIIPTVDFGRDEYELALEKLNRNVKIYNKLIRDRIPEIIENDGRKAKIRILDDEEYRKQLNKKLQEEVKEYLEDNNVEELADIVEVVYGILNSMNVPVDEFERIRNEKKTKNGGFEKRLFLEEAEMKGGGVECLTKDNY